MNLISTLLAGVAVWLLALPAVEAVVAATARWPLQVVVHPLASVLGLGLATLALFVACRWLLWLAARYVRRAVEHVPHPRVVTEIERASRVAMLREVTLAVALLVAVAAASAVWTQGWRPAGTWYLLVLATLFALVAFGGDRPLALTAVAAEEGPGAVEAPVKPASARWQARVWTWEPEPHLKELGRAEARGEIPWRAETLAALAVDDPATPAADPAPPGSIALQLAEQIRQTPAGAAVPDQPILLLALVASALVQAVRQRPDAGTGAGVRARRRAGAGGRGVPSQPGAALAHGAALDRGQVRDLIAEVLFALDVGCDLADDGCTLPLDDGRRAVLRLAPDAREWRVAVDGAGDVGG